MAKNRLIIFDLLRIAAISLVLASHLSGVVNFNGIVFGQAANQWIGNVFYANLGNCGVILFIGISGAVLELNKKPVHTAADYGTYLYQRLVRLYPAYWISLLFGLLLLLYADTHAFGDLFWQFSGFNAFVNQWGGVLNGVGWYIGLIVSLYLLFPFLSRAMEKKPWLALMSLFIIQVIVTFWLNSPGEYLAEEVKTGRISRWFPLCSVFYFGAGIFLVRKGFYPKREDTLGMVSCLGMLSFYVFLFHYPILRIAGNYGIPVYLAMAVAVSMVAMTVDGKIQTKLRTLCLSSLRSIPVRLR